MSIFFLLSQLYGKFLLSLPSRLFFMWLHFFFQDTGKEIDTEMNPIGKTDDKVGSEECHHTNDDDENNEGMF